MYAGQQQKRWQAAQRKENAFWKKAGVLDSQMQRVLLRYAPVIAHISKNLPANSTILDVGCGPTCVAQLFDIGLKIYLDSLMHSYLLKYQDRLPKGEKICGTAEQMPFHDNDFDVVLCINALDHMCDPLKALSEIWFPFFQEEAHPYSFTLNSIRKALDKLFLYVFHFLLLLCMRLACKN